MSSAYMEPRGGRMLEGNVPLPSGQGYGNGGFWLLGLKFGEAVKCTQQL